MRETGTSRASQEAPTPISLSQTAAARCVRENFSAYTQYTTSCEANWNGSSLTLKLNDDSTTWKRQRVTLIGFRTISIKMKADFAL